MVYHENHKSVSWLRKLVSHYRTSFGSTIQVDMCLTEKLVGRNMKMFVGPSICLFLDIILLRGFQGDL